MRVKRKYIVWAAVGGIAAVLFWLGRREKPLEVDTAVVSHGMLQVTVDAEGRTRVRERYVVTAPVTGRLQRIALAEGATVQKGDVIAHIAPLPLDAQALRQAQARLEAAQSLVRDADARTRQAEATLAHERRAAARVTRLVDAGALPERDREDAQLAIRLREEELDAARSRGRAAQADVEQARAALLAVGGSRQASVAVHAPADGCILRVPEPSERVISAGTPLAELGDPGALELVVDILSSDAARVRPGAPVLLHGWGNGEALDGRVRLVEPAAFTRLSALGVEEQRVNVHVDIPRPPPELGDGFRIEARIVVWEQSNVLVVPVSALFRHEAGWHAYAIVDGRAVLKPVQVGEVGGTGAEVLSGLDAGDRVILFPSDQVRNERRVAVLPESPSR